MGDVEAARAAPDPGPRLVVVVRQRRHVGAAHIEAAQDLDRLLLQLRRQVDDVVLGQAERVQRGGPGRERLGRRELLARHYGRRHRTLLDRPDRLAGLAVEGEGHALFGGLNRHRHFLAVDGDVDQDRHVRQVVVPDRVMDRLEVPDPLAALDVYGDGAGAEQVVPRPEPAVVVDGRRIGGDVDDAALHIGRQRRPRGDVAGPVPGVVLPGVEAEFALGLRDDVELPLVLAGPRVVGQDVARHVLDARLRVALLMGVAHHDRAVDDDWGRRVRDVADLHRDALVRVVLVAEVRQQVDDAGVGEALDRHRLAEAFKMLAGLRVERVQEEGGRDDVDDAAPVDLGVADALAVAGAHRLFPTPRVRLAVGPERLAGGRVDGRYGPPVAGDGVEDAVDVARRRARQVQRMRPEVVPPPDPRHLEVPEVVGVDLVERRVPRAPGVAALVAPFAVGIAARRLRLLRGDRRQHGHPGDERQQQAERTGRAPARCAVPSHLLVPPEWETPRNGATLRPSSELDSLGACAVERNEASSAAQALGRWGLGPNAEPCDGFGGAIADRASGYGDFRRTREKAWPACAGVPAAPVE